MAGQTEFLEMIQELERISQTQRKTLSMDMIRAYFSDMDLEDSRFDFICSYLESKGIKIEDRVEKQQAPDISAQPVEMKEDPKDDEIAKFYIEEAKEKGTLSGAELNLLGKRIAEKDADALSKAIDANLMLAVKVAGDYKNRGLLYSDLIQEANISMMMALNDLMTGTPVPEDMESYLKRAIRAHLESELESYNMSTLSAMKMAEQVNLLNNKTMEFARENGREGKPDEIAELMGISEEEVRELMKVSLDAISVMDSSGVGDFDSLRELAEGEDLQEE